MTGSVTVPLNYSKCSGSMKVLLKVMIHLRVQEVYKIRNSECLFNDMILCKSSGSVNVPLNELPDAFKLGAAEFKGKCQRVTGDLTFAIQ